METDHIGSHIDQIIRIVDIFPAVQIEFCEISESLDGIFSTKLTK